MSVRAWLTISAVLLIVLGFSAAIRFFSPLSPPDIVVTTSDARLEGYQQASCWPQRAGDLLCEETNEAEVGPQTIDAQGDLLVVVVYPSTPAKGAVKFKNAAGEIAFETTEWARNVPYNVPPGDYTVEVEANYAQGAYVRWDYPVRAK